jgi:Right handed beta helix region
MILDKRLPIWAGVLCLAAAFADSAVAAQVYPGCAVPPTTFNHVWIIDPVNGKTPAAGGLGTQAAPWNSLQAAFSVEAGYTTPLLSTAPYRHPNPANPADAFSPGGGPIQPGDEILLMSGEYGDISIGYWNMGVVNPQFVTIAAAPSQTPVLSSLAITGSSGFVFSGIKVQSLTTRRYQPALVNIVDRGSALPTSNIVLSNVNLSAADPSVTAAWTQAQWVANTRVGINAAGSDNGANTTCVSIVGSHITAVFFGVEAMANRMLLTGNEIDHFGDDGVDYAASNLTMTQNYIHDVLDFGVHAHPDGFQGYAGKPVAPATYATFSNILIDSNRIIRRTDPNLPFPFWLDGIDDYSYQGVSYTGMTITNNLIVTTSCAGILFGSISNSVIANNTVVGDGLGAGGCSPGVNIGNKTGDGPSSRDTRVFNNIASELGAYTLAPGVTADHNVLLYKSRGAIASWYVNGAAVYMAKPGVYGDHNIIVGRGAEGEFVNFDPAKAVFDMRLKAGARAIGAGSPDGAPPVDITGAARGKPVDAGAYRYSPGD